MSYSTITAIVYGILIDNTNESYDLPEGLEIEFFGNGVMCNGDQMLVIGGKVTRYTVEEGSIPISARDLGARPGWDALLLGAIEECGIPIRDGAVPGWHLTSHYG